MNVFYEEDGAFKAASILADQAASLQIETPHGKRAKIKATNVLFRFNDCTAGELMAAANREAEQIPLDFLWEVSGESEFAFDELARDYFGDKPAPAQSAAIALRLHSAPMYFYRKGRGRYRAAPAEALEAALAGQARRAAQAAQITEWKEGLLAGSLPEPLSKVLPMLLHDPDRNSLEWKALDAAAAEAGSSAVRVLERCGAIPSTADYHLGAFLARHFPGGRELPELPADPAPDLPLADVQAFSIDDASTTEIDDAFSVTEDGGLVRIGIHIAAPALGIRRGSALDEAARERMSTVYLPGDKITMLPEACLSHFSLQESATKPAVSLYLWVDADGSICRRETRVEMVQVAANLRHDLLDTQFTTESLSGEGPDYPWRKELMVLHRFARRLEDQRGKSANTQPDRVDYSFQLEGDRIEIRPRGRGSPTDTVVSELMILANSSWGQMLDDAGYVGIYRSQTGGKTRMGTQPAPHLGLNVSHYTWASSPLRRYADLINQRQIVALALGEEPIYGPREDALHAAVREFELAYDAYAEFQRHMERYWCLRYIVQENLTELDATVIRDDLVRIDNLPLVSRARGLPLAEPGSRLRLVVDDIDLLEVSCRLRPKDHV